MNAKSVAPYCCASDLNAASHLALCLSQLPVQSSPNCGQGGELEHTTSQQRFVPCAVAAAAHMKWRNGKGGVHHQLEVERGCEVGSPRFKSTPAGSAFQVALGARRRSRACKHQHTPGSTATQVLACTSNADVTYPAYTNSSGEQATPCWVQLAAASCAVTQRKQHHARAHVVCGVLGGGEPWNQRTSVAVQARTATAANGRAKLSVAAATASRTGGSITSAGHSN